ncbi:MAG: (2Fe-2S)-binding protein [Halieaceae bacterium]|jgi:aerobic-type carbon monoxide dehydrogenase small subunit (CoxS/CutS family)|nr:(2Fe-2S)-binding protein [Halieaceae bacterium]
MSKHAITLKVNGASYDLVVASNKTLLEVLRDQLNMPETKYGCGTGECGACSVLVEGDVAINSCLTLAATMDGREITTAAGLQQNGELHPVQQAFIDHSAVQCGYCTPGMVVKGVSLLAKNPNPTEQEIREGLEGSICRCTGYVKIVEAVDAAGKAMAVAAD